MLAQVVLCCSVLGLGDLKQWFVCTLGFQQSAAEENARPDFRAPQPICLIHFQWRTSGLCLIGWCTSSTCHFWLHGLVITAEAARCVKGLQTWIFSVTQSGNQGNSMVVCIFNFHLYTYCRDSLGGAELRQATLFDTMSEATPFDCPTNYATQHSFKVIQGLHNSYALILNCTFTLASGPLFSGVQFISLLQTCSLCLSY